MRMFATAIILTMLAKPVWAETVLFCEISGVDLMTFKFGRPAEVFDPPKLKRFKIKYDDGLLVTKGLGEFDYQKFEIGQNFNHKNGFFVTKNAGFLNSGGVFMINHHPDGGTNALEVWSFGSFMGISAICEQF